MLMEREIPKECFEKVNRMLEKMKLKLNEEKSRMVKAYEESFDFLGHTFRYSRDLHGRSRKYLKIEPSKKSQKKVKTKIREHLKKSGHKPPQLVAKELNAITRGWINYFTIKKVTYPSKSKRNLRYYLSQKLTRYYQRKSQRKCKLYNQGAFEVLVKKYGLIDPTQYAPG